MIRYNKSVIDWFLEQQLLSSDQVNNCILLCNLYCDVYLIDLMGVACTSHNWWKNLKINRNNWCCFVMQFAHISNTRILKETLSNISICLIDCSIAYFMVVNKYCNIMRFLHFCFIHSRECNFQYLDRCILLLVIRKGQWKKPWQINTMWEYSRGSGSSYMREWK